jgi:hypothetical protein
MNAPRSPLQRHAPEAEAPQGRTVIAASPGEAVGKRVVP